MFRKAFADYLERKSAKNELALCSALSKFRAHYAYLRVIAKANGLQPFDARVAEALWIGNSLLQKVKRQDMAKTIVREFSGEGLLPKRKAVLLAKGIPRGAVPHHSFHTLYLHTITGVVPPSLRTADMCRISWGRVVRACGNRIEIDSQKLARKKGKLALVARRKTVRTACAGIELLPKIRIGETVASHWGFAVAKLSRSQRMRLEKYTRMNLRAINRA